MPKNKTKKDNWKADIVKVFLASLVIGFALNTTSKSHLSESSIEEIRRLNQENHIRIEQIAITNSGFKEDLLSANILKEGDSTPSSRGLIATVDDDIAENTFLLLEPANSLTDDELKKISQDYKNAVPEFEHVEIDQDIELQQLGFADWIFNQARTHLFVSDPYEIEQVLDETHTAANEIQPIVVPQIKVGVIDTGIDHDHEIFNNVEVEDGWNFIRESSDVYDDIGHGTHIAGIISSHSSNIKLFPYKVVDITDGRLSHVLKALSLAKEDEVEVINMSFGFSNDSHALKQLIEDLRQEGVVIVAAAGNKKSDAPYYPATYADTVAVASVDDQGEKMPNSNYGDWIDAAAPGNRIYSSLPGGDYGTKTGTSQAAAFVSAESVNLLQQNQSLSSDLTALKNIMEEHGQLISTGPLAGAVLVLFD